MSDVPETHRQFSPAGDHHPARSGPDEHVGHDPEMSPESSTTALDQPSGECDPVEVVPVTPPGNFDALETESHHASGAERPKSADAMAPTRPGQRRGSRNSEMLVVVVVVLIMVSVAVFVIEIATH